MADEMVYDENTRSLHRGRRRVPRTETCRPCLVWRQDDEDTPIQGVVLDVNPYGMLIRMIDAIETGTLIRVQLMRDDDFIHPLSAPVEAEIVRIRPDKTGLIDHGIQVRREPMRRDKLRRPINIVRRREIKRARNTRMHNIDFRVGDNRKGR